MSKILKLLFGLLFGIIVVAFGLLYAFRDRLANFALSTAKTELADQGIFLECSLDPVTIGPDLGLRLKDVKTYRDSSRDEVGATFSSVDVKVHLLPTLLNKKPYLGISTKGATLTVSDLEPKTKPEAKPPAKAEADAAAPAPPKAPENATPPAPTVPPAPKKAPEPITISGIDLNLEVEPSLLKVSPSSIVFQGVRYEAKGTSVLPKPVKGPHKPLLRVVEVKDPEAAPDPSKLDFSGLVPVAAALDYRKAGFQPVAKVTFKTTLDSDAAWIIDAQVDTESFPSRGKNLALSTSMIIKYDASGEIKALAVKDGEALLEGHAGISKGAKGLDITGLNSTLDWIGILRDLPVLERSLDSLTVTKAPKIELSGLWSFEEPHDSIVIGSVKGLDLTWTPAPDPAAKAPTPPAPLVLTNAQAAVDIKKGSIDFKTGSGTLADGPVTFEFGVRPFEPKGTPWTATFAGERLNLAQLTACFAGTKIEGQGTVEFQGVGNTKVEDLNGTGTVNLQASQSLKIPMVGPLIDLLGTVIPNLLKTESDRLQGSFLIKNGVLSTKDLVVGLSAAQVNASGEINLVTDQTTFQANANLRGALQRFTPGLGNVLAVEGGGPVKKVNWRFTNLQGASSLSDLIRGIRQPTTEPAPGGQGTATPGTPPASGTPATPEPPKPESKTENLLRKVDEIGGLLKGIKQELKPAPAPAPPAPNP